MLYYMLHLQLVGRNVVGENSNNGVKTRDDDDMQI